MQGAETDGISSQPKTSTYIKVLLAARLAIISFFMGLVVFYQAKYGRVGINYPALGPVAATYLLTIFYAISLRFVVNYNRFSFFQLSVDLLLVAWIIFCTGGINSPYSFMFALVIIASAYFRRQVATYSIATAASLLYTTMLAFQFFGVLDPYHAFPPLADPKNAYYVFMTGVINVTTFYVIALMSSYFTGLLSKSDQQLIEKSRDFTMLQAFHENVLKKMGLGFLAIDLDRTILSHNPAAERILRLPAGLLERRRLEEVLGMPELVPFFDMIDEGAATRQFDGIYRDPQGSSDIHLSITISKFVVSRAIHGFIAVFQDVTELKMMERQVANSERLAAIGRVAAGIAHEIRNPLASLSGSIQMLNSDLEWILDEQSSRLMKIITREADRLNNIITEFLNYTAPATINPVNTDISQTLTETAMLLEANPDCCDKIGIVSNVDPGLQALVDPEQFKQVIWNLSVNAIEAMPGGGKLTIEAHKDKASISRKDAAGLAMDENETHDFICVIVRDTGPGIPEENVERIFEPFFTTKSNGTGLGLPTVHKIMEVMNGKIEARSKPGEGTAFTIWLPVKSGAPAL